MNKQDKPVRRPTEDRLFEFSRWFNTGDPQGREDYMRLLAMFEAQQALNAKLLAALEFHHKNRPSHCDRCQCWHRWCAICGEHITVPEPEKKAQGGE